jgi:hypothetical protein
LRVAIDVDRCDARFESLPSAVASSFKVSKLDGALSINLLILSSTYFFWATLIGAVNDELHIRWFIYCDTVAIKI